jgi:hypothetical protein
MNWKAWLQGLLTAVISAFATAASGAIALPTVFSFNRTGLINVIKMAAVPALLAFFAFLKQNPTPQIEAVVDQSGNVTVKGNPIAEVSVKGKNEP